MAELPPVELKRTAKNFLAPKYVDKGVLPEEMRDKYLNLKKTMNESNIIGWEEAQRVLDADKHVLKCGLPEQKRPTEPENSTNVDVCIEKLKANDPNLKDININNMKRTPIPQIQKMLAALAENNYLRSLEMANVGLNDNGIMCLIDVLEQNTSLRSLNLETNYLTGEFLTKLFQVLLKNQTLEEIRVANQGPTMSNQAEMDISAAICENDALIKVGLNFRRQEARHNIDRALYRNNEMRRVMRQQDAKTQKPLTKPSDD